MEPVTKLESLLAELQATGYHSRKIWEFVGRKFPDKKMVIMAAQSFLPDAQVQSGVMFLCAFLQAALQHQNVRDVVNKAESMIK